MIRRMKKAIRKLERASRPLEPGPRDRKRLRKAVTDSAERFLRSLDTRPAYQETADKGAGLLDAPITEEGIALDDVLALLERDVIRPGGNPASAGHLAYIPGGGIYHSALGDYLAAVSNKYAGIFFTGPGPVRMEHMMVRWVADLVGYPASAAGSNASGGSIATLTAITTARDAHELRAADYPRAVVYLTDQAHHCIEKALRIAGLAEAPVRRVAMDAGFRMRPEALAAAIAGDRGGAAARPSGPAPPPPARPLRGLVIAAAGTTDVGAVDPLVAIGAIARREK